MTALAPIVGYLIGSLPTTNGIARLWGVDLRSGGTGNPGTNNARRLGGYGLAGIVLIVEVGKGVLAVFVGFQLGGDLGAALAGIGAVAGNVYNVWYRFRGGKGLGIAGGVLLAIWPLAFPIMVAVLVLATLVTGSSGQGALIALVGVLILSIVWTVIGWSTGWGASDTRVLILLSAGFGVTLAPKHLHDAEPGNLLVASLIGVPPPPLRGTSPPTRSARGGGNASLVDPQRIFPSRASMIRVTGPSYTRLTSM